MEVTRRDFDFLLKNKAKIFRLKKNDDIVKIEWVTDNYKSYSKTIVIQCFNDPADDNPNHFLYTESDYFFASDTEDGLSLTAVHKGRGIETQIVQTKQELKDFLIQNGFVFE
jgi:hypothetical protein